MATGKKSFVLYCDLINAIDHLTTLEKGKLFEHLLDYVNDKNPTLDDRVLLGSWKHIEQSLKRDLLKYEKRAERSRENGALGGRPKNPKKPSGLIINPEEPKKPDSDNVSVTVNVSESDIITPEQFLEAFNRIRKSKGLSSNIKKLAHYELAEFKTLENYSIEDFELAINNLFDDKWVKENKQGFPSHFLKYFTKYLNAEPKKERTIQEMLRGGVA